MTHLIRYPLPRPAPPTGNVQVSQIVSVNVIPPPNPTQLSDTEYPKQNFYTPPFETATKKYIPMVDQSANYLVMMGTTEATPIDTDWDLQDTATFLGGIECVYGAEDDDGDFHFVTMQTSGRIAYHVFDPGTDAWTIKNETIEIVGGDSLYDGVPSNFACAITTRAQPGDVVVFWRVENASSEEVMGSQRSGGSWTNFTTTRGADGGLAMVAENVGATDPIRCLIQNGTTIDRIEQADGGTTIGLVPNMDTSIDTSTNLVGKISGANPDRGLYCCHSHILDF